MPDENVTCGQCGKSVRVSEYALGASVKCPACGGLLLRATQRPTGETDKPKLTLKKTEPTPERLPGERSDDEWRYYETMASTQDVKPPSLKPVRLILAWLILLLVGGLMWALRYGDVVPVVTPYLQDYGPYAIILFHIGVTLMAFKDDVFQGILCLLVPCYWAFYLFLYADAFIVRALVAGCLVGIAEDSYYFYNDVAARVYDTVNAWLASGGGDVIRRDK